MRHVCSPASGVEAAGPRARCETRRPCGRSAAVVAAGGATWRGRAARRWRCEHGPFEEHVNVILQCGVRTWAPTSRTPKRRGGASTAERQGGVIPVLLRSGRLRDSCAPTSIQMRFFLLSLSLSHTHAARSWPPLRALGCVQRVSARPHMIYLRSASSSAMRCRTVSSSSFILRTAPQPSTRSATGGAQIRSLGQYCDISRHVARAKHTRMHAYTDVRYTRVRVPR